MLGGGGSDLLEGRGGDDILDGDSWLDVQLSSPLGLKDSLTELQAAVLAGTLDPGAIGIVRSIKRATPGPTDLDSAVFSGPRAEYDFTPNARSMVVTHARGNQQDGTDRVDNIERLIFADQTVVITNNPGNTPAGGTVTVSSTTPNVGDTLSVNTTGIADPDGVGPLTVSWQAETSPEVFTTIATGATFTVTSAQAGQRLRATVTFTDGGGVNESVTSDPTAAVASTPARPGTPTGVTATAGDTTATVSWIAPTGTVTDYQVELRIGTARQGALRVVPPTATSLVLTGLTNGTTYNVRVRARNGTTFALSSPFSAAVNVTPAGSATVPGAPVIGTATQGGAGGALTALARWTPPASTGGSAITGYRVYALRMAANGTTVLQTIESTLRPAGARRYTFNPLPAGNYRFEVAAVNAVGTGPRSARSNQVAAR